MNLSGRVIADNSDIASAQSPALASDERSGDLTAGHDARAQDFDFGAEGREAGKAQNGVGGIFADAEDVEASSAHRAVVQSSGRRGKIKRRERGICFR